MRLERRAAVAVSLAEQNRKTREGEASGLGPTAGEEIGTRGLHLGKDGDASCSLQVGRQQGDFDNDLILMVLLLL